MLLSSFSPALVIALPTLFAIILINLLVFCLCVKCPACPVYKHNNQKNLAAAAQEDYQRQFNSSPVAAAQEEYMLQFDFNPTAPAQGTNNNNNVEDDLPPEYESAFAAEDKQKF